jgi:hypothetical protein
MQLLQHRLRDFLTPGPQNMQYSLISVGIKSIKQRWNNCWQEQNHSIPFLLDTHQNYIVVSEES